MLTLRWLFLGGQLIGSPMAVPVSGYRHSLCSSTLFSLRRGPEWGPVLFAIEANHFNDFIHSSGLIHELTSSEITSFEAR